MSYGLLEFPFPIKAPFIDIFDVNVFDPENVWSPVVISPGFTPSAAPSCKYPSAVINAPLEILSNETPVTPANPGPVGPVRPSKPFAPVGPVTPEPMVDQLEPLDTFNTASVVL